MRFGFLFFVLGAIVCFLDSQGTVQRVCAETTSDDAASSDPAAESDALRTRKGLLALYDFGSPSGSVVKDRAGSRWPVDLWITEPVGVRRSPGSLQVHGNTLIRSQKPPTTLIEAIRSSGELTIEAWVRPASTNQSGPARIVTLSRNGTNRNFTLGQNGGRYDVRLRTESTSSNGLPSVSSKTNSLKTELTHVVYTRSREGQATIYINGKQNIRRDVSGSTSNWDGSYQLALANEQEKTRPWRGTYYLVAIYDRNLTPTEIARHFQAGVESKTPESLARAQLDHRAEHFQTKIAPLLAHHCLECHDTASKEGGLDLSRKVAAFSGGDSGAVLVSGKSAESLLWEMVESDEMPADRPTLSADEKELLQKWIDDGATWSIDQIDPAVYVHGNRESENWLRRLTVPEYIETVRSAVGVDIGHDARKIIPPDLRADGFSNTAYNLNVDLAHVEAYAQLAEIIVDRMDVVSFAGQFSKSQKFTDKDMGNLITKMGMWLLRGPIAEHEVIAYRGISTTVVSSGGDFEEAVGHIIEAMLQSPRFIYRIENQRGDGTAWQVGQYELASRMSFIVWGGPPDRELMKAADSGDLYDRRQVDAQLDRMLKDPRAVENSLRFISEWLNLSRLSNLKPNAEKFPDWDAALASDMRDETLAFFHDVIWEQNRPMADLLNAQVTYATPRLAKHYRLRGEGTAVEREKLLRHDLSTDPARGGLLTHGSVLTVGGDEASTVTRGLFVMHQLLRGVVKDPPPCVDTTPVPTKAGVTQRSIAMGRIADANCGGCHSKFEPLAFGLEKYDGLGAFHEKDEHGNPLRDDGEILVPGDAMPVPYNSAAELMDLLADSPRVKRSITWKLAQFALGRPLVSSDAAVVEEVHRTAQTGGGTYVSLIKAIVMSDLVQLTRTQADTN